MSGEARFIAGGIVADRLRGLAAIGDGAALVRALRLLGTTLLPIAALTGLIWGAVYIAFRADPDRARFLKQGLAETIIDTQIARVQETGKSRLAFIGDSACLMGIHVPTLQKLLSIDKVESFCSIGHVGPVGYAHMIDRLVDRDAIPERLVIAMHPSAFARQAGWDETTQLVLRDGRRPDATASIGAALDYARGKWMDTVLYKPLWSVYGLYYGSHAGLRNAIRREHGSTLNPGFALQISSLEEFRVDADTRAPAAQSYPYTPNAAFNSGLEVLARAIEKVGAARAYLLLTPVPDVFYSAETERTHDEVALDIARRLGIPARNILPQEGYASLWFFTDTAHMNRWGRILYTKALARHLAPAEGLSH